MKPYYLLPSAAIVLFTSFSAFSQSESHLSNEGSERTTAPTEFQSEATASLHGGVFSGALPSSNVFSLDGSVWSSPGSPSHQKSSAASGFAQAQGGSGYSTSIGLRGGYTSGISLKHFIGSQSAVELVVGSRWSGFSITGLYELHKSNALGVSQLSWVYGIGARVGSYRGSSFYQRGRCNNPNDRRCGDYWGNRNLTAVGIVAIGGLEYHFEEIPFTISLDLIPVVYLNYWTNNFIDASLSVRYVIK